MTVLEVIGLVVLGYFTLLNLSYFVFTLDAWSQLAAHRRSRDFELLDEVFRSSLTPPVSVLLPAHNEQRVVVDSVRSLLQLRHPQFEVVVVDDGSTDDTLAVLVEAFDLVEVRTVLRSELPTRPVRAVHVSRRHPELTVISKEKGGKADALNCGVNAARYPYFCAVDADAILEADALLRVSLPVLRDPERVVAAGGIIRIANGCTVDDGRVVGVGLPRSRIATMQVVEYFRAFLIGRVGWSRMNALLIISGAFGLFKRSVVLEAGGYRTTTVGEDAELVVRMHRLLRDQRRDYRIVFVPDPVCWTEVPEDLDVLGRQRRRWQRGLVETLHAHRGMALRPAYGRIGIVALPYYAVFEMIGPLVELIGYLTIPLAWALGALDLGFVVAFLGLAIVTGTLLSVSALALEELNFRAHERSRDMVRLVVYAVADNVGYRQLTNVWRTLGLLDAVRRRRGWGEMRRKGPNRPPPVARDARSLVGTEPGGRS